MPTYLYRAKKAKELATQDPPPQITVSCMCWAGGVEVYQAFASKPLEQCPECGEEVYRAITSRRVGIKVKRSWNHDYREDLARFPRDPEAFVDGPKSLQKLIDKRKADGWTISKQLEEHKPPKPRDTQEVMREAYQRAKARGFRDVA